ncbi:hemolysin family protein [Actinomycetaceae bacterium L2_0104]
MNTSDLPITLLALLSVLGLLGAALCSAGVAALGRITRNEAAESFATGQRGGQRIIKIVAKRPAATVGLTSLRALFTACYAMLATLALTGVLASWWQVVLAFLGISLVVLLLTASLSPTAFGVRHPVRVLGWLSAPILAVTSLFGIFVRTRETSPEESEQLQEDQLAVMVERVSESEALDDDERELLQSMFEMGKTLVREVMVPRTDMITIGVDQSLDKALSLFTRSGYSRVPATGEDIDDVQGVVYLKDVMRRVHHRNDTEGLTNGDVMREPFFVPETMLVDDLMREMQADQVHIALVVDEYGGIAGLVTIEDLVEELVGEISDEHDRAEPVVERLSEESYRVPARLPIDELGDLFSVDLQDDDVDTAGGLFAKLLGRVPLAGAEAEAEGIHMAAERFEGRRRRLATIIATRAERGEGND